MINPYSTAFSRWWCHSGRYMRLATMITSDKAQARLELPRAAVGTAVGDLAFTRSVLLLARSNMPSGRRPGVSPVGGTVVLTAVGTAASAGETGAGGVTTAS